MRWFSLVVAIAACGASPAFAVQPDEILPDPALEARARTLSRELRCMVCQNQSIDDSDAPLARDLRLLVRERLKAGDSDAQVLDFLTARYGQFVLLKPRFGWDTALLWLAPAGVLSGRRLAAWCALLRRRRAAAWAVPTSSSRALTAAERGRLAQLLADGRAINRLGRHKLFENHDKYLISQDYQRLMLPPRAGKAGAPHLLSNDKRWGAEPSGSRTDIQ